MTIPDALIHTVQGMPAQHTKTNNNQKKYIALYCKNSVTGEICYTLPYSHRV